MQTFDLVQSESVHLSCQLLSMDKILPTIVTFFASILYV